jgi:hypothetical protein
MIMLTELVLAVTAQASKAASALTYFLDAVQTETY